MNTAPHAAQGEAPEVATEWPTVSVLMPCYNAAAYIGDSIRSVLCQDYPGRIELIVVDDGSTDRSVEVAGGFDAVRVLRQRNQGPAAARNLALAHASGALVAFLDADDQWLPGALRARVTHLLQHDDAGAVFADFTRWTVGAGADAETEVLDHLPTAVEAAANDGWLYPEMLLDPIVHIITMIVRKEVLDQVGGFDPSLRMGEDYDLLIRIAQRYRFARLRTTVARYRLHAASTTRMPWRDNLEYRVVQRAIQAYGVQGRDGHRLDKRLLAVRLQRLCFGHAYRHFWHGDPKVAVQSFAAAIRHDPLRAKAWVYALLSAGKALLPQTRTAGH